MTQRTLEAAALIVLMAAHAQERVGVAQFTDRIEWLRPPRRGRMRALAAIRAMEAFRPSRRRTSLAAALAHAGRLVRAAATIVVISDFIDGGYEPALATLRRRHDVLALCPPRPRSCLDGGAFGLGAAAAGGLVRVRDPESGRTRWLDTSSARVRAQVESVERARVDRRRALFYALGVPRYEASQALACRSRGASGEAGDGDWRQPEAERAVVESVWLRVGERL